MTDTTAKHSKYHSIDNFRLIIQDIKKIYQDDLPILKFIIYYAMNFI